MNVKHYFKIFCIYIFKDTIIIESNTVIFSQDFSKFSIEKYKIFQ